ncbi:MAG: hypothetical protein QM619_12635 [Micropruina sp.]|uniref:O-methyltransferase n=1 Tax=Micropruina sp. TaxID=2737536 RepID=UPI0039E2A0C7
MSSTDDVAAKLVARARDKGFAQSSTLAVGQLLSVLAASKPGGRMLELGTGVGLGVVHLLRGMSATATLVTVELDPVLSGIAQDEIDDPRVEFVVAEGGEWLASRTESGKSFDLVFADTWPGKFSHRDEAMALVAPGGLYVVDDLLPQPSWPPHHQAKVDGLTNELGELQGWATVRIDDATGVMICTRLP